MKWQRKWTIRRQEEENGVLASQTEVAQRFNDAFAARITLRKYTICTKLASDKRFLAIFRRR
jgi:hypothetical protein